MSGKTAHVLCVVILSITQIEAAWAQATPDELRRLTIEELMNIQVTTPSRIPTTGSVVPVAVHVITQEDIRRSGATSLPEVLRQAPGVHVGRIDAGKWAIGIRGFTDRLARSMLVLIDGRAVYSPLFAGTYWEVQDTMLEDIERIEIIRGPGGTLWGANAVNGIINIITKTAGQTRGLLATIGGGSEEQGLAAIRYGGTGGQNFAYRAYGKFQQRDAPFRPNASEFGDWQMGQGGFRADWNMNAGQTATVQGDLYQVTDEQVGSVTTFTAPYTQRVQKEVKLSGGNILTRWEQPWRQNSDIKLQLYFDRTHRQDLVLEERRNTFEIDFQQAYVPAGRNRVVWGFGYRVTRDDTKSIPTQRFIPASRTDNLFSAFVQDEITLASERARLTLGSKFEHNGYSGFEAQPSARIVWTPASAHTLVLSVTHAVRTPTRVEHDYEINTILDPRLPGFLRLHPNDDFQTEKLIAYETGYRVRPIPRLFVTLSGFLNQHEDLLSTEVSTPFVETQPDATRMVLPLHWRNNLNGNSHGLELTVDYRATQRWRWTGSYSNLRIQLTRDRNAQDLSQERTLEGNSPQHQIKLHSSIDVLDDVDLDWNFQFVSGLPNLRIRRYATTDVRIAWRPSEQTELSIIGKDLHDPRHPEFSTGSEIQRRIYGQLTWRW